MKLKLMYVCQLSAVSRRHVQRCTVVSLCRSFVTTELVRISLGLENRHGHYQ